MRLLLDTHALLWWVNDDKRLKPPERDAVGDEDSTVWVSAASIWEISSHEYFDVTLALVSRSV